MDSGRGGERPGAGRPKGAKNKSETRIESKGVRLSVEVLDLAQAEADRRGGKATARSVIEELVTHHFEKGNKILLTVHATKKTKDLQTATYEELSRKYEIGVKKLYPISVFVPPSFKGYHSHLINTVNGRLLVDLDGAETEMEVEFDINDQQQPKNEITLFKVTDDAQEEERETYKIYASDPDFHSLAKLVLSAKQTTSS